MEIRKATLSDMPTLMRIFDSARAFMRATGNLTQWVDGYPSEEQVRRDVENGHCYCVVDASAGVVATFCLIPGEDPNYRRIDHGRWLDDRPYATIHRLASDGSVRGVAEACFDWCLSRYDNLRADTHADNKILQHILAKYDFVYCGIVHVANGTERLAFQRRSAGVSPR